RASRPSSPAAPASVPAPDDSPRRSRVGEPVYRTGCAAAACHGGSAAGDLAGGPGPASWASAATQGHARDPPAPAAEALAGSHAARIMGELRADRPDRWNADALAEARCLACHTNPALAAGTMTDRERVRHEGVSCEACHGNAGGWLLEHPDW